MFQIARDLRFAIRTTNRNRSQIARFGALRSGVTRVKIDYADEFSQNSLVIDGVVVSQKDKTRGGVLFYPRDCAY